MKTNLKIDMAFLKLFLSIGVLFIAIQSTVVKASVPTPNDVHNSEDIKPHHYSIKIAPAIEFGVFIGECKASIEIRKPTQTITLHSENIAVNKVKLFEIRQQETEGSLRGSKDIFAIYKPTWHEYDITRGILVLHFNNNLCSGNYILNLYFSGSINDKNEGLFRIPFTDDNGNKLWILATHSLITGARGLFPCWNDPALKTTFNISIRHHKTQIALSNMPKRDSEVGDTDIMWTHFHITPSMSTHDIALTILPKFFKSYTRINESDVTWYGDSATKRHAKRAHRVALDVMSFLKTENALSELKVPRVSYVAIPGFQYETIATLGIVLHRQEDIVYNETVSFIAQKINVDRFVARQVALQWFIGSMKPSLWSYQWLNGVAEFFGIYALDKVHGTTKMMNWFVIHTVHNSLHLDVNNLMEPITKQGNILSNATRFRIPPFIKVPVLLRMMEGILKQTFWSDTRAYLKKESITDLNFWTCMPVLFANFSFCKNTFRDRICNILSTQSYPLLNVKQKDEDAQYIYYIINVANTSFVKKKCASTQIHVSYTIYANLEGELWNGEQQVYNFQWIEKDALQLPVRRVRGAPSWLIVNINQTGYYRVAYAETWNNIGMFLNSSVYRKIPVLNRAQIIDDAYHLVMKKLIPSSKWFKLISYLKEEQEYEAWYPMIRIFEDISGYLPFEDQTIIYIKEKMVYLLDKLLHKIGFSRDDKDLFQVYLKYEAIKWSCLFNSAMCVNMAAETLQIIINNPIVNDNQMLLWNEWIYCDGLRNVALEENLSELEKIILNFKLKNNYEDAFLKVAPCFDYNTVFNFFNFNDSIYKTTLPFYNSTILQDFERVILFQSFVAKHANSRIEDILNDLFIIKPRFMKPSTALCIIINHVYSHAQLLKIKIFVAKVLNYNIAPDYLDQFFEEVKELVDEDATLSSSKIYIFKKRISLLLKKIELRFSQINKHIDSLKELKVLIGL